MRLQDVQHQVGIETGDEAIEAYVRWHEERGQMFDQPARNPEYDPERGGWVLENIRGVLAIVSPEGELLDL